MARHRSVEPAGWRAAFWVCAAPLLFVPVLAKVLYWVASFGGLLLVYGVATWLPTLMRGEGHNLGSALTFVVLFNVRSSRRSTAAGVPRELIASR